MGAFPVILYGAIFVGEQPSSRSSEASSILSHTALFEQLTVF